MAIIDEMMTSDGVVVSDYKFDFSLPKYKYNLRIGSLSINIVEGKEPNWFYRWAQRICLGLHWEKIT